MTYTYKLSRRIALLRDRALISSLALAAACGGTDLTETDPGSPSQAPSAPLVVIPQVVTIETNQTVSFAARERSRRAVVGAVQWAVSGGRISHDGAFTSSQPGTFMLVGRIQGEREQFPRAGTARVRVVPAQTNLASIRVAPENVRLAPGAEQAFEASGYVPNQGIQGTFGVPIGVTWTASGGRVDASGVYTAGDAAGTFRVTAKSVGTGVADTVMVVIDPTLPPPAEPAPDSTPAPTPDPTPDSTPPPPVLTLAGVVLTPSTAALQTGETQQFAATGVMSDGSPASVTFSYSATGGSITPQGLYQAGATGGTFAVIATAEGGIVADTAELTITVPVATPPPPAGSCLAAASGTLVTLAGTQTASYDTRNSPLPSGVRVSAKTAVWNGVDNYLINFATGAGACWSGGTATGKWNQLTTPWDTYHGSFGLHVYAPNVVVERLRVHNYGDGVRFTARGVTGWTLRSNYFSDMHDDCMEDDLLTSGTIEDNLFDGCYVGISMRPAIKDLATVDGRNETVVIKNNLLRIKPFALTNKDPNTSGGFMKTENREPAKNVKVIMVGNIFRADGLPGVGTLCLNQHNMVKQSSGNILVWLGAGSFPCALPPGWSMTRDVKVWDNAVAAWKARH